MKETNTPSPSAPKNSHVVHAITEISQPLTLQVVHYGKVSLQDAQALIQMGAVYLEKLRITEDKMVKAGSYLRLHTKPRRYCLEGIDWKASVVDETTDFIVVNKPPGIPVPSTVDNLFENVTYQLTHALGVPLYVTQRLDRPTSGLLILAKTKTFQREFNQLLFKRLVKKQYASLTKTYVVPDLYSHHIENSKTVPKKVSEQVFEGSVTADLRVRHCFGLCAKAYFESEIELLTGRTHQIRAQFSFLGHSILGDTTYGGEEIGGFHENKIALRSTRIEFLQYSFKVRTFGDEVKP